MSPVIEVEDRRSWVPVLAAALLIAVIGVAVFLISRSSEDVPPVTTPTETTLIEGTTSTSTVLEPTTTIDPADEVWNQQAPWVGAGIGDFRTNHFGVPFSFSMGDTVWKSGSQREDAISVHVDNLAVFVDVFRAPDSIEETVETLRAMHEAVPEASMSEPVLASLAGAEGVMFATSGLPILGRDMLTSADLLPPGVEFFTIAGPNGELFVVGGEQGEVYVLDVAGETVVVSWRSARVVPGVLGGGAPPEDVLEDARQSARELIETIVWKDIG